MSESAIRTRRWTRVEYDKLIETGFLGPGDKIELLGGQLCVSEPQNSPHARAISLGLEAIQRALAPGWHVRVRCPSRSTTNPSPSRTWRWSRAAPATMRVIPPDLRLSSKSPTRAWRSTASTRAASTRARVCQSTGS